MKTKALISFVVTAKLICVFVFTYAKSRFSHDAALILINKYADNMRNKKIKKNNSHTLKINKTLINEQHHGKTCLIPSGNNKVQISLYICSLISGIAFHYKDRINSTVKGLNFRTSLFYCNIQPKRLYHCVIQPNNAKGIANR